MIVEADSPFWSSSLTHGYLLKEISRGSSEPLFQLMATVPVFIPHTEDQEVDRMQRYRPLVEFEKGS
jgi:hypothetical protein